LCAFERYRAPLEVEHFQHVFLLAKDKNNQRRCVFNRSFHSTRERAFEIKYLKIELISRLNSQREFYFITTIINCFHYVD